MGGLPRDPKSWGGTWGGAWPLALLGGPGQLWLLPQPSLTTRGTRWWWPGRAQRVLTNCTGGCVGLAPPIWRSWKKSDSVTSIRLCCGCGRTPGWACSWAALSLASVLVPLSEGVLALPLDGDPEFPVLCLLRGFGLGRPMFSSFLFLDLVKLSSSLARLALVLSIIV